ncbi:MAG: GNAT family N-acetyltransferase [Wolbachia endosymbiont of Tyrophagus putrescentiae]|nr:GNAT family N-acetyltransferase [Wolbachia endosymbiont of Tyrophagus putrescentiae]
MITFTLLKKEHFPLLLKWLEAPHVKLWWDKDIHWTIELIERKYSDYTKRFKRLVPATETIEKPMHAFIINFNEVNIGYIQYYSKHDFPPTIPHLPESCAAIDWYIGEPAYIGRGIGTQVLSIFLDEFVFKNFEYAFIDSNTSNIGAIRVYEKAGFKKIREDSDVTLMLKRACS